MKRFLVVRIDIPLINVSYYSDDLQRASVVSQHLQQVGADRVVLGSDWPFANARVTAEAIRTYEALEAISAAQRAAIDRGNALALFPKYR